MISRSLKLALINNNALTILKTTLIPSAYDIHGSQVYSHSFKNVDIKYFKESITQNGLLLRIKTPFWGSSLNISTLVILSYTSFLITKLKNNTHIAFTPTLFIRARVIAETFS